MKNKDKFKYRVKNKTLYYTSLLIKIVIFVLIIFTLTVIFFN